MIPFNKPFLSGNELQYMRQAIEAGKISGDGVFTNKCHSFFEKKYGFKKSLLTTSCTDALEMAALLINIREGDEVIMPSFTFVSTANPFVLRGARIVFVDSRTDHPGIDESKIEELITDKTKAIVVVHYAGIACNMDEILRIAAKYNLYVIEDAAQSVDSFYWDKPLGAIGHLSAFSFHETKNIISGEGGMLAINDDKFSNRAEILWEKGTNRSAFFRGEIDKYGWVDVGASFLPSDLIAAFLFAQLENLDLIQARRKKIWETYYGELKSLEQKGLLRLPFIPSYATNNGHLFFLLCNNLTQRDKLLGYLKGKGIHAVFHYQSLHKSNFYKDKHDGRILKNCDLYAECLLRLPLFYELADSDIKFIVRSVFDFYK
ncbi:MAG: dTDP-4-amino-4,6-dideoxygalactose transaminase [Bacteroidetes bacterium]|nr:MAG: dTDP-4-amino-4,6-dideoxygalactose transaminase [Bacteroidota bacterium]